MHRAVLASVIAAATALVGACSPGDETGSPVPTAAPAGPVATAQQFDHPFPVSGEDWDATVTLSNLRIVPSSAYSDAVVAVDLRAVQSAGQPELGPADLSAFDPAGRAFDRIEDPSGTVEDPLVPSIMTTPGEEIRGMVAWTMPRGARIGRIELATPGTVGSVTVTRQPVDPLES